MKIRIPAPVTAALLFGGLLPGPVAAQAADEGTLLLRAGGREIGSESFRVVLLGSSIRITSRVTLAGARPPTEFTASSERSAAGALAFQLAYRGPAGGGEVYAVQQRNRLTIRHVERGAERASEAPGGSAVVLLADSIFAPFLQMTAIATEAGRPLTAVFPRTGRRLAVTIRRLPGVAGGGTRFELAGDLAGEILLGNRGELTRISFPALGMEAVRQRE